MNRSGYNTYNSYRAKRYYRTSGYSNTRPYLYPNGSDNIPMARTGYRKRYQKYTGLPRTVSTVCPRPEIKYFDFAIGPPGVPMDESGSVTAGIFAPTQGASNVQYLGNQINLKSFFVRYTIRCGTGNVPCSWRLMILYDRQSNGTNPVVSDIINGTPAVTSYMNLANRDRFVVLVNQTGTCNPAGQNEVYMQAYKKINMQATFASPNLIPTSGSILFFAISDQVTPANQPLLSGVFRTKFVDC